MSKFFEEIWESIFTPGTTPSLLIATNVTFAVLQLVLFALLLATYSIHFVILSFLSGSLWWAINWFAAELKASQLLEEQEAEKEKKRQRKATPVTTDSETEVETTVPSPHAKRFGGGSGADPAQTTGVLKQRGGVAAAASGATSDGTGAAATDTSSQTSSLAAPSDTHSQGLSGSRSGVSTEDEWEKVSENEKDK